MSQEEINVDLFNEIQRLKQENQKMLDLITKVHKLGGINKEIDFKCWKVIDNYLKEK